MNMDTEKPIIRVGICDDIPQILDHLHSISQNCLNVDYTPQFFCCMEPKGLLDRCEELQIAILDIQLDQENGIEVAKTIRLRNPECRLIFVTGYVDYVSDVYEIPHLCLILKNQLEIQLPRFLPRAAADALHLSTETLQISSRGQKIRIPLVRICSMERQGHTTILTLQNSDTLQTREKLDVLMKRCAESSLLRCHVSYVVNFRHVSAIEENCFRMENGIQIPISRIYYKTVRAAFFRYLQEQL